MGICRTPNLSSSYRCTNASRICSSSSSFSNFKLYNKELNNKFLFQTSSNLFSCASYATTASATSSDSAITDYNNNNGNENEKLQQQKKQSQNSFSSSSSSSSSFTSSSFTSSLNSSPISETLNQFCRYKQHPLSIKQLTEFGRNVTKDTAIESCIFVRTEVCTRIAHMLKEMEESPLQNNLMETAPARLVEEWYQQSLKELVSFPAWTPEFGTQEYLKSFNRLIKNIHSRHGPVVPTMAQGLLELKHKIGKNRVAKLPVRKFLDRFYMSRIGIRLLISQHLELFGETDNQPSTGTGMIGVVSPNCDVGGVAQQAAENARFLCSQRYCDAPEIRIQAETPPPDISKYHHHDQSNDSSDQEAWSHDAQPITFPYVPSHLYHIMFELLKNSTRAVVEFYGEEALKYPPVDVVVSEGKETLCIRVSDLGGGIPHSAMRKLYSYLYTTAAPPQGTDMTDMPDMNHAPLAGFGYGLPLSRLYARYFKGDLTVQSMEGRGTDAYVYLKVAGDANEVLPRYDKEAIKHYIPRNLQDWTAPLSSSELVL